MSNPETVETISILIQGGNVIRWQLGRTDKRIRRNCSEAMAVVKAVKAQTDKKQWKLAWRNSLSLCTKNCIVENNDSNFFKKRKNSDDCQK